MQMVLYVFVTNKDPSHRVKTLLKRRQFNIFNDVEKTSTGEAEWKIFNIH